MKNNFLWVCFLLGFLTGIILVYKYKRRDLLNKIGLPVLKIIKLYTTSFWKILILLISAMILNFIFHGIVHNNTKPEKNYQIGWGFVIEEVQEEDVKEAIQKLREDIKELEKKYEVKEIEEGYERKRIDELEKEIQDLEAALSTYKERKEKEEEKERKEEEERKKDKIIEIIIEFIKYIFTYLAGLFTLYLSEEIKDKLKALKENRNTDDEDDSDE